MTRCKGCDHKLKANELYYINQETGEPEDLCIECLSTLYEYDIDIESKDILTLLHKNGIIYIE